MELHIKSDFDCVYLINGELAERADTVCVSEFDVVYVTVLPLRLDLLPYTVRLCGADNTSGEVYSGVPSGTATYTAASTGAVAWELAWIEKGMADG